MLNRKENEEIVIGMRRMGSHVRLHVPADFSTGKALVSNPMAYSRPSSNRWKMGADGKAFLTFSLSKEQKIILDYLLEEH